MRTREVESKARKLLRWEYCQALLTEALAEAQQNISTLESDGYFESGNGTMVSLVDDCLMASEFIGTVFALCPSGKYYTPWANSNVESCPRCKGKGKLKVYDDCQVCKGNGRRMVPELAAIRNESEETTRRFLLDNYPDCNLAMGHFDCIYCKGKGKIARVCDWCEGLGSREAYLDEIWYSAIQEKAESYGLAIESGEGDPCDLFVVAYAWPDDTMADWPEESPTD